MAVIFPEITGPVDRKMVINALNSGAKTFMADFEDSNSPNIHNNLQGQINLRDANLKSISFLSLQEKKDNFLHQNKLAQPLFQPIKTIFFD